MPRPPLHDVVVFDFTRHLAGPFATMILRDLGARVVKFEPPGGDPARAAGPFREGDSAYFHPINRGKESVVVDLSVPDDVARVRRLLPMADCLVENSRPGFMERIGLGPDSVRAANPRLVYAACSGFGADGPYASRPAYDVVAQAMGGIMSVTGTADGPPTRVGVSQADIVAGVYTALAVVTALRSREETGEGAFVDVSMLEAQLALATHAFGIREATGADPQRIGNRHPAAAPFDVFETRDGHIAIATVEDRSFHQLCAALALEDALADPRFATRSGRLEHVDALTVAIATEVAPMTTDEALGALMDAGVACGPVQRVGDLLDDAHVEARGALLRVGPWGGGELPVPGLPFKIDRQRWAADERGPELGASSLDRLEEELRGDE